jgi:ubiquinone/menaquinone biosynthesis C-methylase UbiE
MKQIHEQTWWTNNLKNKMDEFCFWIGDCYAVSKVFCRSYIANRGYKTLLDCGCGVCTEYYGYKEDGYEIEYTGIDATKMLVEMGQKSGINVVEGYLEELPFEDKKFDVVYIRHVLEHLPHYHESMSEAIRVAKKEVIVVFFIKPNEEQDFIDYNGWDNLFHNHYNKEGFENYLLSNEHVASVEWRDVNEKECVALIKVKDE